MMNNKEICNNGVIFKAQYFMILVFLVAFLYSCQGHKDTSSPIQKADQVQVKGNASLALEGLLDHDPYFVESSVVKMVQGPRSITRNILEDSKGNFWFASWEGIIGFDGAEFTNYTNKESLRRYHVFSVIEDSKGGIWFGTIGAGVYYYDGKEFQNYSTTNGLVFDRVGCIYEDTAGLIWIGTEEGISCYDNKTFKNLTESNGLCDNDINSIVEKEPGKYWIGTRGAACVYDGKTFEIIRNENGASFTNVRSIIKDGNDNMWFGGNDGFWKYDGKKFTQFHTAFTGGIYEDSEGNIWTGSIIDDDHDWGLMRYDSIAQSTPMVKGTSITKQEGQIFGIIEDHLGNIWYGHEKGVTRYDGEEFKNF